jgi:parallel beta-helix repeat protein
LSSNYFYGVEDRSSVGSKFIGNVCNSNGDTGVATSSGGRGINLWKAVNALVDGNTFKSNSEYGFRIYSEAADSTASYGCRVVNNYGEDNSAADFLLYDETADGSHVHHNTLANNIVTRSTNPSLGVSFLLQGGDNTVENCHVRKTGTIGTFVGFNLNDAFRNKIYNSSAENTADALGFSDATDCVVDGFDGLTVATAAGTAGFVGAGNVLKNARFKHGGAGASDVALPTYNGTGRNYVESCVFDGFNIDVYIRRSIVARMDSAKTMTRNRAKN